MARYQHPRGAAIDWRAARAAGISFAYIKATESTTYTNAHFRGDWAGARAAGLYRGAYHFARPSTAARSAAAQARFFVSKAGTFRGLGDLPPVLDLETTGGLTPRQLGRWASAWLTTVKSLTGRTPVIYTSPYFWKTAMGNSTAFRAYPLFIAHYRAGAPTIPGGWPTWTFWQNSQTGRVPGILGAVDTDRFNGTATQLRRLANDRVSDRPGSHTPVVTVTLSKTSVTLGARPTLTVRSAASQAGRIAHRQQYIGGRWVTLATAKLGSKGSHRFTITPEYRGVKSYRVLLPAAAGKSALASATVRLTVR